MKLFVDESGNTGETLSKEFKFNFDEQPIYVLAGILPGPKEAHLDQFFLDLLTRYKIKASEAKAKQLYERKPRLLNDLIDFLRNNDIPVFIELMDKIYYLNIQITTFFIYPLPPINDSVVAHNMQIASTLSEYLTMEIYQMFINTCKAYSNESLERFYEELIDHFDSIDQYHYKGYVQLVREAYFESKTLSPEKALRASLPIPDLNPHSRWLHLLPNVSAFTGMIGRVQKHRKIHSIENIQIMHDEQKQFGNIYFESLDIMRGSDSDSFIQNISISQTTSLNLDEKISMKFDESKSNPQIQIADLIAGFTMRFWIDFMNEEESKVDIYLPHFLKLAYYDLPPSAGINFVVPNEDHQKLTFCASFMKNMSNYLG